jgi:hypothetical protein
VTVRRAVLTLATVLVVIGIGYSLTLTNVQLDAIPAGFRTAYALVGFGAIVALFTAWVAETLR